MKITLLGDSIRQQYQGAVADILGDGFEIFAPDENCRFAKYTLRGLFDWCEGMSGSRVIHWNNGLWDVCNIFDDGLFSTDEEYVDTMLRIADILLKRCDKLIFATTTPVTKENRYNKNTDIERFNEQLVPKLEAKGVIINDLYTPLASDIDKYISNDNIHLSQEGIDLAAHKVANAIISVTQGIAERKDIPESLSLSDSGAPVII